MLRTDDLGDDARVRFLNFAADGFPADSIRSLLLRLRDAKPGAESQRGLAERLRTSVEAEASLLRLRTRLDSVASKAVKLQTESQAGSDPMSVLAYLPLLMSSVDSTHAYLGSLLKANGLTRTAVDEIASFDVSRDGDERVLVLTMKDGTTRTIRTTVRKSTDTRTPAPARAQATPLATASVQPNPAADAVTVRFSMERAGTARFSLYDLTGRLVHEEDLTRGEGLQSVRVSAADLAPGGYVYRLRTGDGPAQRGRFTIAR